MPRSIWTGAISFGLVTVPVKLYSAVSRKSVRFHQLNKETGVRIQQKRVDPTTGDEVPYEDIVKGYELTPDRYVVIEPGELEALDPKKTKSIEIEDFVSHDEIDPIYFDHPYYLAPGPGGAKPYKLLFEAMKETNRVAIANVVIRSKQQLVAVRPMGDSALSMSTMVYPDEVVDPSSIDELAAAEEVEINKRELDIAKQLVDSLAGPFELDKYRDTYREEVLSLVERKAAGRGDRSPAGRRGGGCAGARPHVRAEGEPRRREGARRQRRGSGQEGAGGEGARQEGIREEGIGEGHLQELARHVPGSSTRRRWPPPPLPLRIVPSACGARIPARPAARAGVAAGGSCTSMRRARGSPTARRSRGSRRS